MANPGPFKRALYPPSAPKGPVEKGDDIVAVKRAVARAGFFDWNPDGFDNAYNEKIADSVQRFQRTMGLEDTGYYGEATHQELRQTNVPAESPHAGADVFDHRAAALYRNYMDPAVVPALGPVFRGGESVLKRDLTHATSGIPLYPAFDDAFREGVAILAPEDIEVTKASSSSPGDACYAKGESKLGYWFGHLTRAPAVGTKIPKGGKIGVTCRNSLGGGPHVHVGVNVEGLWGKGKQMTHHTNYTHGAPLIGAQLEAGRPL